MASTDRLWIVLGTDYPDNTTKRMAARPHHLAYWQDMHDTNGRAVLQMGGPVTDDAGDTMIGSMFVIRAPDIATARALLTDDPYVTHGVFETYEIRPWKWLVGTPDSGVTP
ncbi:YciI family protein [Pyruvatibacter sp.]|uniref:YciI family protein n=1 Tax=Pyruvatibacter sp. TaxID=1981328 RepID=UPI0032EF84F5